VHTTLKCAGPHQCGDELRLGRPQGRVSGSSDGFFLRGPAAGREGGGARRQRFESVVEEEGKLNVDNEDDVTPAPIVCEYCGGTVPQVALRVASLDGTTLVVTVAQRGLVREVKRLVGQVRERSEQRESPKTD
jgi:hypothetical protein